MLLNSMQFTAFVVVFERLYGTEMQFSSSSAYCNYTDTYKTVGNATKCKSFSSIAMQFSLRTIFHLSR